MPAPVPPGDAHVVIVGTGALGARIVELLAAAGVGRVTLADPAAPPGADVAPFVEGGTFDLLLDADLVVAAIGDADALYLADDAAAVRGIPLVWADPAAGEVGIVFDEAGVDYRDLHPVPPPARIGASLEDLADIAADEALTALAGAGPWGRVHRWDVAGMREEAFGRDPGAPRPGSLEERTAIPEPDAARSVTAPQLAKLLAGPTTGGIHEPVPVLLDVRETPETTFATLPSAVHIPLAQLPARIDDLAGEVGRDAPIVVYCHHGVRSSRAMGVLERSGFTRVRHLTGGIDAYAVQVDPSLPRY
jgi:adenylyltransferase/sulfurtransferase